MEQTEDSLFLLTALKLAEIRRGFCAPNPSVGAIVVKNGVILAEGYHYAAGLPHAEPSALNTLTLEETTGSTLYVTLEPCCHFGRTPPCTDLIIAKKVARVVYGYQDPNPKVMNKGAEQLRAAGIHCDYISLPAITQFYESYAFWQQHQRPFITAKLAITANNKCANQDKSPLKITNSLTDTFNHQQRLHSDAILTTAKTVLMDNPKLTARLPNHEPVKKPIYVLDRELKLPLNANLFHTASTLTVFHEPHANPRLLDLFKEKGATCHETPLIKNQFLDLKNVFKKIGEQAHDLAVEAGPTLFHALLEEGWTNRLVICQSDANAPEEAYDAKINASLLEDFKAGSSFNLGNDTVCIYEKIGDSKFSA